MSLIHDYAHPLLNASDKVKFVKLFDLPASYQFINRDDELDCDVSEREAILKAFDDSNVESLAVLYDEKRKQLRSIYTSENSIDDMTPRGGDHYGELPLKHYRGERLVDVRLRVVRDDLYAKPIMFMPENATLDEIKREASSRVAYLDSLDDELDFRDDVFAPEGRDKSLHIESISIREDHNEDGSPIIQFETILRDIPIEEKQEIMPQEKDDVIYAEDLKDCHSAFQNQEETDSHNLIRNI